MNGRFSRRPHFCVWVHLDGGEFSSIGSVTLFSCTRDTYKIWTLSLTCMLMCDLHLRVFAYQVHSNIAHHAGLNEFLLPITTCSTDISIKTSAFFLSCLAAFIMICTFCTPGLAVGSSSWRRSSGIFACFGVIGLGNCACACSSRSRHNMCHFLSSEDTHCCPLPTALVDWSSNETHLWMRHCCPRPPALPTAAAAGSSAAHRGGNGHISAADIQQRIL